MSSQTALSKLRTQLTVDVDSMDPSVAARHTSTTERFSDMTSNQAIVYGEASRPERADILKAACLQAKATGADIDQQITDALDLLSVLLAKEVYPYLTGRVHLQTTPAAAYDTEKTIAHAKKLVSLFEAHGIPKSRVCIKIPATPESLVACQYLQKIGIDTLATCLFSLPQALAASSAGCLYVAPYFNELRVHFEPGVWKEYSDTAKEHPMAPVIGSIVKAFRRTGSKTLVMPASIVTAAEVVALASLNPDHLTLSGAVLDQLAAIQELQGAPNDPKPHHPDVVDYLANGASALREYLASDAEATRKLADALRIFGEMEDKTKALICKELDG
ncbi:aldolase [Panus rudis PR-1116 ss-1]|nr:aldolase [Panus rudis PR-1116 ss-1]